MSSKRPRSSSPSSSHSSTSPSSPSLKLVKVVPHALYASLTCTLPPTCSYPHNPTQLTSINDVEEHYARYHTHVCEHKRCKCVFPDARFLELHFAECHDPITALKKERGETTFACYLATCQRSFLTPKGRRLHLIQVHGYPKQFFFAVTNKGIGGLLHKWGQGASLFRGDWKARTQDHEMGSVSESAGTNDNESEMDVEEKHSHVNGKQSLTRADSSENAKRDTPEKVGPSPSSLLSTASVPPHTHVCVESDTLASAMSSLSLVPDKIRFGRGGKKGGFAHPHLRQSPRPSCGVHPDAPSADNPAEKNGKPKAASATVGRGRRRRARRKPSEGASSTSGDPDLPAAN